MKCRHCSAQLNYTFIDLGSSPPSNSYLTNETMRSVEKWYPLKVLVCENCWLVQTEDFVGVNEMFSEDYAYFSSFSQSWLEHARNYIDSTVKRFNLSSQSTIVEVAANDGYLLQFAQKKDIPCYGFEPTHSTALSAREKGVEIIEEFFGVEQAKKLASQGRQADLTVANNVLAHVPDINDFVEGFSILLKENGVATFEFPHLLNLVEKSQFDTIYHEHYSYLSMVSIKAIFEENGLTIFDVEELSTHGGSLRIYAQRSNSGKHPVSDAVHDLYDSEIQKGVDNIDFYNNFQEKSGKIKSDLTLLLLRLKNEGKKVIAYGAAAKGNTMMNFSGIRSDLVMYVVDKSPSKIGKFMPGSRIPIVDESIIIKEQPDFVLILPWNLKTEIETQLSYIRGWEGQFIVGVPSLEIW